YYRSAKSNHTVQIVIPNGQYRPQFVLQNPASQTSQLIPTRVVAVSEPSMPQTRQAGLSATLADNSQFPPWRRSWPWLILFAALISASALAYTWRIASVRPLRLPGTQNEKWSGPSSEAVAEEFRILT